VDRKDFVGQFPGRPRNDARKVVCTALAYVDCEEVAAEVGSAIDPLGVRLPQKQS
jgi:hypothetical protein